jgi:hypothetical protein
MRKRNRIAAGVLLLGLILFAAGCGIAGTGREAEPAAQAGENRTVVFEVYGIQFVNPYDTRKVATGETLKAASDQSNLYLEDRRGSIEPIIPRKEFQSYSRQFETLSSEQSAQPARFSNPRPVNGGRQIVFNSNKTSLQDGSVRNDAGIYIISLDGSDERQLLDGEVYGNLRIVDTIGTRIYAEGGNHSLIVMDAVTFEVRRFLIGGRPDAVSADGNYVLFRKVEDGYILPELYVFNLATAETQAAGTAPDEYFFSR